MTRRLAFFMARSYYSRPCRLRYDIAAIPEEVDTAALISGGSDECEIGRQISADSIELVGRLQRFKVLPTRCR